MMSQEAIKNSRRNSGGKDLMLWALDLASDICTTEDFLRDPVEQTRALLAEVEVDEDNTYLILSWLLWGLGWEVDLDGGERPEGTNAQRPDLESTSPAPKA